MSEEISGEQAGGCALVIWSMFVTTPMWLCLVFALMSANEMPTWSWVLYWCYVPAVMIGVMIHGFIALMKKNR